MARYAQLVLGLYLIQSILAVKVKVVMHSEQEESKIEDDEKTEQWEHKKPPALGNSLFFIKKQRKQEEKTEYEEEKTTTEKNTKPIHPNDMIFPLIYRQNHINSMFKFGENWYTWSSEKKPDGTKSTNYFICYDEPKRCDEVGWERIDTLPRCAFQIESLVPDDRACVNSFGVEPHGLCEGTDQMKVTEIIRSCGPRIRSLWRFVRVGRRPANAVKPADVNSLLCEDEEECFITIEYRIHHDRITFSMHEPTRGQTFKSALKREVGEDDKVFTMTEAHYHKAKKIGTGPKAKINRVKVKSKGPLPKIAKENDSGYSNINRKINRSKSKLREDNSGYNNMNMRINRSKVKLREENSEDMSE